MNRTRCILPLPLLAAACADGPAALAPDAAAPALAGGRRKAAPCSSRAPSRP
jgi:hypothetical protein